MARELSRKVIERRGTQNLSTLTVFFEKDKPFAQVLKENPRVMQALSEEEIDHLMDPYTYLGLAPKYVEQIIDREKS